MTKIKNKGDRIMINDLIQVLITFYILIGMFVASGLILIVIMIIVTAITKDKSYFRKKIDNYINR